MIFSSLQFLVFFAVVFCIYLLVKNRGRWHYIFLLAVSYVFYFSWSGWLLTVLASVTMADFFLGKAIEKAEKQAVKKRLLYGSIIFNLSLLAFFKYAGFFTANLSAALQYFHASGHIPLWQIALPVGISYFTFKSMSYTLDVYKGTLPAEKDFLEFAVFVSFFPELMAGPIVRAETLLPQLSAPVVITYDTFSKGLKQFITGFFKKLFIADMIAPFADNVFGHPAFITPYEAWVGVIAYAIQIYCDFSGYTDMAIGLAQMLGYEFPENFNLPFRAANIAEFWRRWNISVTSWFFDYLYTPLVFRFRYWGRAGLALAVFITFVLTGFWHGAGWNFIVFGALHGLAFIIYYQWTYIKKKLNLGFLDRSAAWNVFSIFITLMFVILAWVFFRSPDHRTAGIILQKLAAYRFSGFYFMPQFYFLLSLAVLGTVFYPYFYNRDGQFTRHPFLEKILLAYMVIGLLIMAPVHTAPFIYFRF